MTKTAYHIVIIGLFVLGLAACEQVGEKRTDPLKIDLGEAKSVVVNLRMSAGELTMQGGAQALAEGSFTYNVERWKPRVDYQVSGDRGRLSIEQRKRSGITFGDNKNRWDIRLTDQVPLELKIKFGAGEGDLDLRGLNLKSLEINMGVGELKLDLSGERKENLDVRIDGGIGEGTIYLPENIGVRVKVNGGIGSVNAGTLHKSDHHYTNDAYGKAPVTINIDVEAGIGSINLRTR
jgi:hypothetical protein